MTSTIGANTRKVCVTCHSNWAEIGGWRCESCAQCNPNPRAINPTPTPQQHVEDPEGAVLTASWQSGLGINDPGLV
jgi:hypothetical protein